MPDTYIKKLIMIDKAKYFRVSDSYFLDIQDDIDIRNAKIELELEINGIKECEYLCSLNVSKKKG